MPGLRIVRGADDVAPQILAQDFRVAALCPGRHRLPDEWKCLMTIEPAKFNDFAV